MEEIRSLNRVCEAKITTNRKRERPRRRLNEFTGGIPPKFEEERDGLFDAHSAEANIGE